MRERLERFMMGRYGVDPLSRFMLGAVVICMILSFFFRRTGGLFSAVSLILLVLCYFRMFSKDVARRYEENEKFERIKYRFFHFFSDRKDNHIFKCPSCKQKIRVPKGKGKIEITCPKCRNRFIKRS